MHYYQDLNQAFAKSVKLVNHTGEHVRSRGTNQKEILFHTMCIEDPTSLNIEVPIRRFNADYAIGEWLWYVGANPRVNNIGKLAKIWEEIQDIRGLVESNYGSYIFETQYSLQWHWVREELLSDNDTRRATIVFNQPYHKNRNHKDYPCTQYIHFFIRNGELDMGVHMRSNDAVFGFCNDVFTFSLFQQMMLNELNAKGLDVSLGKYYHTAGSFHIYERHFPMMEKITNRYNRKFTEIGLTSWPELPKFTLNKNITYDTMIKQKLFLPMEDLSKEELYDFIKETKEVLFV